MTHPDCPKGAHGPMDEADGQFCLQGIERSSPSMQSVAAGMDDPSQWTYRPDGRLLAVKVFVCTQCGYVELKYSP